jgi:hypothetical protein
MKNKEVKILAIDNDFIIPSERSEGVLSAAGISADDVVSAIEKD